MAVVIQPVVTKEKARELLAEECESDLLDFKSRLDLRDKRDTVQLVKDISAMQIKGGFILVGADGRGQLLGQLTDSECNQFDEAKVRAKALKYLPDSLRLFCAHHQLDGKNLVLIFVAPNPEGFLIFKADGNYPAGDTYQAGCAFRKGEVYARHGSASEVWNQSDRTEILHRLISAAKEAWLGERREEMTQLLQGITGQRLATGPAVALTWDLEQSVFESTIIELARRADDVPFTLLIKRLPNKVANAAADNNEDQLIYLLDRVACFAAILISIERPEWFKKVINALVRVYDLGFDQHGQDASLAIKTSRFWLLIIVRVVALGGLLVRLEEWDLVRDLTLRKGRGRDFERHYVSWIRHGLTMAARNQDFTQVVDGQRREQSLISLAHALSQADDCLRPDLSAEDERLLDSLCQFDALAMVASLAADGRLRTSSYYPSFSRFYGHRTLPALAGLVQDSQMRESIIPNRSDQDLANALRFLDHAALSEGFRFAGWEEGLLNAPIQRFLERFPVQELS